MTDASRGAAHPPADVREFAEGDLPAALALLGAEGWSNYIGDGERTLRAFTAAGATTLVALADGDLAGIAHAVGDGEINSYLALLLVRPQMRRRGVGRALVLEVLRRAGALRLDLLSDCDPFFAALGAEACSGFRLPARRAEAGG